MKKDYHNVDRVEGFNISLKMNWKLLRKQKDILIKIHDIIASSIITPNLFPNISDVFPLDETQRNHLAGIIDFIEAIQCAGEDKFSLNKIYGNKPK